eukprot:4752939-Pyramimonas_sp.AAC.2
MTQCKRRGAAGGTTSMMYAIFRRWARMIAKRICCVSAPAAAADITASRTSATSTTCKPHSRLSASQWQSVGREYTPKIRWNIRNAVR